MALTTKQLAELRRRRVPGVGNKLATAIELADVRQADIVAETGYSPQYVSDVARGRYPNIGIDNAWRFALFFGCDPGDLFPPTARQAVA